MAITNLLEQALEASYELNLIEQTRIDDILIKVAQRAVAKSDYIIEQNALDLAKMERENPLYDRLMLNRERIEGIAADMRNVASLRSPVGEVIGNDTRPNGMTIEKIRVPFGVIGVIYEARPNVSFDVFSLCFKTKNISLLKGGKDALHSNMAIVGVIKEVFKEEGMNENFVNLLPVEREATAELLNAVGYVDLIIPRGSSSLINFVRDNSRVPVIETGAGICHTYFHKEGDVAKGVDIIFNAKCRRVSVCNAMDCLIIDRESLGKLPQLCEKLDTKDVVIYADEESYKALEGSYKHLEHATKESFGTEFMEYKMAIKTVDGIKDAIKHIAAHSSKHSESIVTEDSSTANVFLHSVDAACVYHNVSTAFTDGAQFGFGAEIGISTQKLHARGPMALPELTSYKYIIKGNGQIRS